jgi:hypothetical protein
MVQNYKLSCKAVSLQIQKKCYTVADIKLAMDKVVVNAQWHVHGYSNIISVKGK